MSIAPFPPVPARSGNEGRRARLAVIAASVGIVAVLIAYAVSPGVRHGVNHTVNNIFDHDRTEHSEHRAVKHGVQDKTSGHARTGMLIPAHALSALAVSSTAPVQEGRDRLPLAGNTPT